jgi:hypothetical protein
MTHQPPPSFGSKMSSFFRSLNCCGGSADDDDEPRAIQIVSPSSMSLNPSLSLLQTSKLTISFLPRSPPQPTSAAKTSPCPASRPSNKPKSAKKPAPTPRECGTTCNPSPPRRRRNSPSGRCRPSSSSLHLVQHPRPGHGCRKKEPETARRRRLLADEAVTTGAIVFGLTRVRFRMRLASRLGGMRRWAGCRGKGVRMRCAR